MKAEKVSLKWLLEVKGLERKHIKGIANTIQSNSREQLLSMHTITCIPLYRHLDAMPVLDIITP